ncbi:DUF2250 domain-containing protein [Picrophilus oshimae]|nr:DUF2250 domain-containing protein [Picrophilus oshimae]SMD31168.1 Uncharacterized protein SAMN02745355_1089 [Picrophilus oshimae DSM 9789]
MLTDLEMDILKHLDKYGPDSPSIIWRRLLGHMADKEQVRFAFKHLKQEGYIRYYGNKVDRNSLTSSLKKTLKIKARKSNSSRSYYELTEKGYEVLRKNQ